MPEFAVSGGVLFMWAVIGYLLGSIPSGVLIAKAMGLGNLRDIGSGNIGATNVLRTGNKKAAVLTLLFDAGKGLAAVLLARAFAGEGAAQVAALFAFLGHCYPVWLEFKGGKGVATYFGILFGLSVVVGLVGGALWIAVAAIWRYSSMAALVAAGWVPVFVALWGGSKSFVLLAILGLLIYWRHRGNIQRLRAGTEGKIGAKG